MDRKRNRLVQDILKRASKKMEFSNAGDEQTAPAKNTQGRAETGG